MRIGKEKEREQPTMSKENVTVVRNAYDSFHRGDIETMFDTHDPNVEFYPLVELPWGGRYHSHKEVGVIFQKLTSTIESKVEPDQFVDSGDHVIAVGYTRGRALGTGKAFEVPAFHDWTLKNGETVRAYIVNP
jgi:uncharacterized protein